MRIPTIDLPKVKDTDNDEYSYYMGAGVECAEEEGLGPTPTNALHLYGIPVADSCSFACSTSIPLSRLFDDIGTMTASTYPEVPQPRCNDDDDIDNDRDSYCTGTSVECAEEEGLGPTPTNALHLYGISVADSCPFACPTPTLLPMFFDDVSMVTASTCLEVLQSRCKDDYDIGNDEDSNCTGAGVPVECAGEEGPMPTNALHLYGIPTTSSCLFACSTPIPWPLLFDEISKMTASTYPEVLQSQCKDHDGIDNKGQKWHEAHEKKEHEEWARCTSTSLCLCLYSIQIKPNGDPTTPYASESASNATSQGMQAHPSEGDRKVQKLALMQSRARSGVGLLVIEWLNINMEQLELETGKSVFLVATKVLF